jgi:hypothetical protein
MIKHTHLTVLHELYLDDKQLFRKVHRMIDLFESIIKMHTVVIMAEYVKHNKLSESAKSLLVQGLRMPSLGTWQLFSRVLFKELQQDAYEWTFLKFPIDFEYLDKALTKDITNIIAFRNIYAHGATPDDAQCETDIKKFEPFLNQLLELKWLTNSSLELIDGKVNISADSGTLSLHPLLLYRKENTEPCYAFFNDLKDDKVGLLNYPLAKHYREKDFYREFHEYLPLREWKKTCNNEFYQLIEELAETFKGRAAERLQLLNFVTEKNKGYFFIQGNPGIGKSALIAQFSKDLRANTALNGVQVVEYFILRRTPSADVCNMLNYLIRRTDEVFSAGKEIQAEGNTVFELQNQLFAKWRLWGQQSNGQKLLFLIDGLDEGVENDVVTYLPRENFDNILIIYGSRRGGHKSIDDLLATLPTEHHSILELSSLSKEDIRALIYEVASKYDLERESTWIDEVQKRSQGNSLYLKLLCNAIENGSIALNDIKALPKEIDVYYKAILHRYAQDKDGDALLAGLYTFAAAKDYLTMSQLGHINKLGYAILERIGSTLKEVLYENPLTEEVLDYRLFHESFREYLLKEKAKEVSDAAEKIIEFCGTWKELEGSWEQRYTLEHYAAHLSESNKVKHHEVLMELIYDRAYVAEQMKTLKSFDSSNRLYQLALLKACALKKDDHAREAALCLVDIKYKEDNDAPQVLSLVANGEIDLALKRIENFGGVDEEGLKRKFILYMLCLMELTLLDSKNKPHSKIAIEKLLNHLDDQIPLDNSPINWNDFFSSYLIFQMACELADLELDYSIVYKRTNKWNSDWIMDNGPYSDLQFQVLLECALGISYNESALGISYNKSALSEISAELAIQGKIDKAIMVASWIGDEERKSFALSKKSTELIKQGNIEEALECTNSISNGHYKYVALIEIITEAVKQGQIEIAIDCVSWISDDNEYWKSFALSKMSSELAKQRKVEEAASIMQKALDCIDFHLSPNCYALINISRELAKQGQLERAASFMQEALDIARYMFDNEEKISALNAISLELAKQGRVDEALECVCSISEIINNTDYEYYKDEALSNISGELVKERKALEALKFARGINNEGTKSIALSKISTELAKQGQEEKAASVMQEALELANSNYNYIERVYTKFSKPIKSVALRNISTELGKQGNWCLAASNIMESLALECARPSWWNSDLEDISAELAKQGKIEEALACARDITDEDRKSRALKCISAELAKTGKIEEALAYARGINDNGTKSIALSKISTELAKQGQEEKAASVMQEALELANSLDKDEKIKSLDDCIVDDPLMRLLINARINNDEKNSALNCIATELAKQGMVKEAFKCANSIREEYDKSVALSKISTELVKQGNEEEAASFMLQAFNCCPKTKKDMDTYCYFELNYSKELAIQGYTEKAAKPMAEALKFSLVISDKSNKSIALKEISSELAKRGKIKKAASVMQKALACARGISDESKRSSALKEISSEIAKQGNWQLAEQVGLEIPLFAERHDCWKEMALKIKEQYGWQTALDKAQKLQNQEARLFYLKGWVANLSANETNIICLKQAMPNLASDIQSIENLLQKYALHEIMFCVPTQQLLQRLNKSLNVQWAIDIAAKFPKVSDNYRLSTNLDEWLQEIEDEDDRDQIKLWAKQVLKGKITEQQFEMKLKTLSKE